MIGLGEKREEMLISELMESDHKHCDELFAKVEEYVESNRFDKAQEAWEKFSYRTLLHFGIEEEKLFPDFEEVTGMRQGPTMVMRMEHTQIKKLMKQIENSLAQNDQDCFFDVSETLMILLQQHNAKEEQMLYKMIDQHLSRVKDDILDDVKKMMGDQ